MTGSSGTNHAVRPGARFVRHAIVAITGVLGVMLLFLFAVYIPAERRQLEAEWEVRLASMADDRQAAVEEWVHERVSDATVVAAFPSVVHLAAGATSPPYPFPIEEGATAHLADIFGIVARAYDYRGVYLVDAAGRLLAASAGCPSIEHACLDVARRAMETGEASIDFHTHEAMPPVVSAVAPVRAPARPGEPARVVGAMVLSSDPTDWLYPLLRREPSPTATAESVLVRRQGEAVLFLTPLRHSGHAPMTLVRPLETPSFAGAAALAGVSGLGEYVDYNGTPVLAATRLIRGTPWGLVVKAARSEVLAPVAAESRLVALVGAAFLLAVAAAVAALWRVRRAQYDASLETARARFAAVVDQANDAILFVAPDGRIRDANRRAEEMYGHPRRELIGKSVLTDLRAPEAQAAAPETLAAALARGELRFETKHRHADGRVIPVEVNARKVELGGVEGMLSIVRDVTERRAAQDEREITLEFLRLANNSRTVKELVQTTASFLRNRSGFDAVGLRLHEGDDYPYYEALGFPDDFVRIETRLCARTPSGMPKRDETGNPVLDCMCGNVIRGRFDPSKSFFTEHGSFWTNSTSKLLASTTEADRQARTRNRCNGEGYESVGLFPLRTGDEVLGLLQLNDRRPDRFTPEMVELWERLATNLAVAVSKLRADEALHESEARYRELVEHTATCVAVYDAVDGGDDFVFVAFNTSAERSESTPRDEVLGRRVTEVFPGVGEFGLLDVFRRVYRTGEAERFPVSYYVDEKHAGWRENYVYKLASGEVVVIYEDVTERVAAETALRESEARFRLLFQRLPVPYQSLDREGRILDVNDAWLATMGFERDEVLGRSFGEFQSPCFADGFRERLDAYIAAGSIHDAEVELVKKDGSIILASFEGRIGVDAAGAFLQTHCVFTDITERRRADEALRESEERSRLFIENSLDAFLLTDPGGRIYSANPAACRMFGRSEDEIRALGRPGVIDASDERLAAALEERSRTGRFSGKLTALRAGGEPFPIHLSSSVFTDAAGEARTAMVIHDLSEQVRSAEALRSSEERYRDLVENLYDVIYRVGVDGTIAYISPSIERVLGYTPEEMNGTHFTDRIRPDDASSIEAAFRDRLGGEQGQAEYRFVHKDGSLRWVRTSSRMWVVDGEVAGLQGVLTDITERRRAEDAAREKAAEAERYFTLALDLLCIADADGRFVRLNPEWERALGYPVAQLEGARFLDLIHPDDVDATVAALARLAGQVPVLSFENRYRASDGTYRDIEWRAYPAGRLIYAAARDVTEKKRAEARILDQLDELRRWQGVTLGREGRILALKGEVNEALARAGLPARYPDAAEAGAGLGVPAPPNDRKGR